MNFHLDKRIYIYIKDNLSTMSSSQNNQQESKTVDEECSFTDDELTEEQECQLDRAIEQDMDDLLQQDIDDAEARYWELNGEDEAVVDARYQSYIASLQADSDSDANDDIFANLNREIS